jgi:hypothetical protein
MNCILCRGRGYHLPTDWNPSPHLPPGVKFKYGAPCECDAGREFAADQERWNRPAIHTADLQRARGLRQHLEGGRI